MIDDIDEVSSETHLSDFFLSRNITDEKFPFALHVLSSTEK